jgi:uncharacterized membrane-anchored protein YitT (DUF2179 family)
MTYRPYLESALYTLGGVLISCLGLAGFLLPNAFIDGGVTGISMLAARMFGLPLAIWLIVVNLPFVFVGFRHVGRPFALRSFAAILLQSACLAIIPFPMATHDKLLAATFGGFFTGAGVGLAIRGGSVLDGTEVLAVLVSKRSFATVGEVVLVLNAAIFSLAALVLGVETALYSTLTYFAGSKTIDYVLHGIEAYHGVLIVSADHGPIRQALLSELGRGVTTLVGKGGYTDSDRQVLFCVVTRLEITRVEALVKSKDPAAFFVVLQVHEASGGRIKKRAFV